MLVCWVRVLKAFTVGAIIVVSGSYGVKAAQYLLVSVLLMKLDDKMSVLHACSVHVFMVEDKPCPMK